MKFPLAASPFQPLTLSEVEKNELRMTADNILSDTLSEYETLLQRNQGVLDLERWKPIKRKENLVIYEDRCALAVALQQNNSITKARSQTEDPVAPPPAPSAPVKAPMQQLLYFGTLNCELDDLMLGIVHQTPETYQIRSSYIDDNGLDLLVLASLVTATPDKPFDGLQVKWSANNLAPMVASGVIRNRDGVYLDYTGITTSAVTGDRIGYQIWHSVDIPGVPELPHYKLVRGEIKLHQVFRQKSKGIVEVYGRVMYDLRGDVPAYISTTFSAEAAGFLPSMALCGLKRKLTYYLFTAGVENRISSDKPGDALCGVCSKELSKNALSIFTTKTCRICSSKICSRCRVPKKLSFLNRRSRGVVKRPIDCCTRCVHSALQLSAFEVAQSELTLENPAAVYYESATRPTSSVSSASE